MAERLGVLMVSYGARDAAMLHALGSSKQYKPVFYVADGQRNPYTVSMAGSTGGAHRVVKGLAVDGIVQFAKENAKHIDLGIVGPEGPIIDGVRDRIEEDPATRHIKMLCPTAMYAVGGSRAAQRALIARAAPEANPGYRVFALQGHLDRALLDSGQVASYRTAEAAVQDFWTLYNQLGGQCVMKPDRATAGRGAMVPGDQFSSWDEAEEHFRDFLDTSAVMVEEKIEGEKSGLFGFSDGNGFVPTRYIRGYSRAFDRDKGPNTEGMGSYMDKAGHLPFMTEGEAQEGYRMAQKVFNALRGDGRNAGLLGVPLYISFMHTGHGMKMLKISSMAGDPEMINVLPLMRDDFASLCVSMAGGSMKKELGMWPYATVVTYKVPPTYGGKDPGWKGDAEVHIDAEHKIRNMGPIRLYPGSVEQNGVRTYALTSRAVASLGIGENIHEARKRSMAGLSLVTGGDLWSRGDVGSRDHIGSSMVYMESLRH